MEFTPYSALIGGSLIGVSAAAMLYFSGRITGISGFLGSAFQGERWRLFFLLGLIVGGAVGMQLSGFSPQSSSALPLPLVALGGLFVGFGTRMANGCTSGHGVCGNARMSPRSLVATCVFIGFGMVTTYFVLNGSVMT